MRHIQFIRSNTFLWAAGVAAMLALFVAGMFTFIYLEIDDYLIRRSDQMIATQLNFMAELPPGRLNDAISDHLQQDSRSVQYAGLFDAAGVRMAGNIARLPPQLDLDGPVQSVRLPRVVPSAVHDAVVKAAGRRLGSGQILVMGRNVDEAREISHVVGRADRKSVV